jgi:hypothetical protein
MPNAIQSSGKIKGNSVPEPFKDFLPQRISEGIRGGWQVGKRWRGIFMVGIGRFEVWHRP